MQRKEEQKVDINDSLPNFMEQTNEKFKVLEGHISSILHLLSQWPPDSLLTQIESNPLFMCRKFGLQETSIKASDLYLLVNHTMHFQKESY